LGLSETERHDDVLEDSGDPFPAIKANESFATVICEPKRSDPSSGGHGERGPVAARYFSQRFAFFRDRMPHRFAGAVMSTSGPRDEPLQG
jgi:hypothetical protein